MSRQGPFYACILLGAVATIPAAARVVSYAPLTSRQSFPAVQSRTNRHVALVEQASGSSFFPGPPICLACGGFGASRLFLYDASGLEEPSDATPGGTHDGSIGAAAAREREDGSLSILVFGNQSLGGDNPQRRYRFLFSPDSGATWKVVALPDQISHDFSVATADVGGPFARGRGAAIRIGTAAFPFVFTALTASGALTPGESRIYALAADGSPKLLATAGTGESARLVGTDSAGFRFLVQAKSLVGGAGAGTAGVQAIHVLDLDGNAVKRLDFFQFPTQVEGWIASDGSVYVDVDWGSGPTAPPSTNLRSLLIEKSGSVTEVASVSLGTTSKLVAIPTADFSGAWIARREGGPTFLYSHTPAGGLVEAWRDVTAPEVEALHAGASGNRLLVQVHRPRPQIDQRIFKDPALAVWEVGRPAPARYDELFLNEQDTKGFAHLDVDGAAKGAPFLFDSGMSFFLAGAGGPSGGAGGADVIQEWGVVRASLRQRLVIPAAARASGLFGAAWRTDLVLRNPDTDPLALTARFVPNPGTTAGTPPPDAELVLPASTIQTIPDVLGTLFHVTSGSGAILLVPEGDRAVEATSRTYTTSARGTYGMGVGPVDVYAAVGQNFPITFSAGLLGADYRSNFVATDAAGGGARARLLLSDDYVSPVVDPYALTTPAAGQTQLSGIAAWIGAPMWRSGALLVTPEAGQTIAGLIAIDNRTNDPTWFPPDLPAPAPTVRTIPAIVHGDGANGAKFRSDLYLFNPTDALRVVWLSAKLWNVNENDRIVSLTLLPHESRTIRDVLSTVFGRTGVARLRYQTIWSTDSLDGVRVTSRTYTLDPSGGTYGIPVPPLNSFQSASGGETLEILGPMGGQAFRTDLSLVELSNVFSGSQPVSVHVEILDEKGALVDRFDTAVPVAGGVQLDDLFRARGLGDRPAAALIRVSPSGGLVAAYASMIDNGTNDPTYFAASLAAK